MMFRRWSAMGMRERRTQGVRIAELLARLRTDYPAAEARMDMSFRRQGALSTRQTRLQLAFVTALRMRVKTPYAAAQRGLGRPRACAHPGQRCAPVAGIRSSAAW
jgi:hypothetical protein